MVSLNHVEIDWNVFKMEDIKLESSEMLTLNSLLGKFGQWENQSKTKIINTPEEFFSVLTHPSFLILYNP